MRLHRLLVAALALSVPLCAQTTKKTDHKAPEKKTEAPNVGSPMPGPSPEIQKLTKLFVGKWKTSGKILDENWAPGGASGTGMDTVRSGPAGFTIITDSKMDFGKMGPFAGHGVIFWDAAKAAYSGYWCDSWNPICDSIGLGKWQGDKLVFEGEMQAGPQKMPFRQTYSNFTANGYDWLMESGDGKGNWKPAMQLKYERASKDSGPGAPSGLKVTPQ